MKSGFMDRVATRLIPDHPGQTARWYAYEYLQLGDNLSDAKNPEESLANTLDKQVREGRERRVRRERIGGRYRYFPVSTSAAVEEETQEVIVQMRLSKKQLEAVDSLISIDKFKSRNEAVKWLVVEGMEARREYLDKISDVNRQIEEMKRRATAT